MGHGNKASHLLEVFYEEPEHVFDQFLKYHMKIMLGDFIAKVGAETFSNQCSRTSINMKLVMIMTLEY